MGKASPMEMAVAAMIHDMQSAIVMESGAKAEKKERKKAQKEELKVCIIRLFMLPHIRIATCTDELQKKVTSPKTRSPTEVDVQEIVQKLKLLVEAVPEFKDPGM